MMLYFWSAFVCIILFDLASSVSYGVAIIYLLENYMTCFWLANLTIRFLAEFVGANFL